MTRNILLLLALTALSASVRRAEAAQCAENRDFYQSLPTVIGREDNVAPIGFTIMCDTVFVRKGVTTIIHPGTLVHFAAPTLNSVIKVEGTLIVKGTKSAYVYLSGSLDTTKSGTRQPGVKQWGGIEVAETGRLEMEYAGVLRAPTPITAFSTQVLIVNSFFKGSSGIILPDGSLLPLEIGWHVVSDLDLRKGTPEGKPVAARGDEGSGGLTKEEMAALLARRSPGFWSWKRTAGGAAALAVVAAGALYFTAGENQVKNPPVTSKPPDGRDGLDRIQLPE